MQNCINSLFGQIGRKLKAEGAAANHSTAPHRLPSETSAAITPPRRLTTARPGLRLVLGLERPSHIAGTLPPSHQLGIIPEPIADHLVQQAELLADVRVSSYCPSAEALPAASRPTAPPPPPPAAGSRGSPHAPAAARASSARGPALLRPSGGPEENPEPARPSPAAYVVERSYILLQKVEPPWTLAISRLPSASAC